MASIVTRGWEVVREQSDVFRRETRALWRERRIRKLVIAAVLANAMGWIMAIFIYRQADEPVIALHHTIYFGINLIGEPYKVFALPLLGLGVIAVNGVFASLIRREGDFFVDLFAVANIIVNVFLLLGLGGIALVNFR